MSDDFSCPNCGYTSTASEETAAEVDRLRKEVAKLHKDIHELKRTRSEAEAAAEVAGYKDGQRHMQNSLTGLLMSGRGS